MKRSRQQELSQRADHMLQGPYSEFAEGSFGTVFLNKQDFIRKYRLTPLSVMSVSADSEAVAIL